MQDAKFLDRLSISFLCLTTIPFFLQAYNAGYGFDQLEYLIIGRSLNDGYSLYDFIPSKSFGIYAFTSLTYFLGITEDSRVGLALVITAIYLSLVFTTYAVIREQRGDPFAAIIASALVGLSAIFMELNFLQPTSFVYLFALIGFRYLVKARTTGSMLEASLSGLFFAMSFHFKSVALFYIIAIVAWFSPKVWSFRTWKLNQRALKILASFMLAFMFGFLLPLIYFAATGRAKPYLFWTLLYPALYYPAHQVWLNKLLIKEAWFIVLLAAGIYASLQPKNRNRVYAEDLGSLSLCLGAFSLLALLKVKFNQAIICFRRQAFFVSF